MQARIQIPSYYEKAIEERVFEASSCRREYWLAEVPDND